MKRTTSGLLNFSLVFLAVTATTFHPGRADELSELYLGSSNNNSDSGIGPNILIVLDTSGSMTKHGPEEVGFEVDPEIYWNEPYDPDHLYPGPCDPATAYRKSFNTDRDEDGDVDVDDVRDGDFQSCDNELNFPLAAVACSEVLDNGVAVDRFGEFRPGTGGTFDGKALDGEWESISSSFNGIATINGFTVWRECAADAGVHGVPGDAINLWPSDTGTTFGWTSSASQAKNLAGQSRQLVATGNYINYYRMAQTRLAAVQSALREVVAGLPAETRLGLMRFDVKVSGEGSSDGAYVIKEFVELGEGTNRQDMIERVFEIEPADDGGTPLGESLFEALQVYRGGQVIFGANAESWNIDPNVWPWDNNITGHSSVSSVPASRDPANPVNYESPIIFECQKNAVIFLSDGDPDGDKNTDTYFETLPEAENLDGVMVTPLDYGAADCGESAPHSCLREVADYMAHVDLSPLQGIQTATTHTVGFGSDISPGGAALLSEAAELGGGSFTQVNSYEDLKNAFQVIFREEIASNETLSSPAVTVNAFNRLSHENSLYFTMFDPVFDSVHWPGNVKKYVLKEQEEGQYLIMAANGIPALLPNSSEIDYRARSFWTDPDDDDIEANGGVDGNQTELGGAAGKLTDGYVFAGRDIYTWLDGGPPALTNSANAFSTSNPGITNEMLGLDADATAALRSEVILYMRGMDRHDEDGDGSTMDSRKAFGAAPHGVPAVLTYGSDESTASRVIYAPTNDGFLHAIDADSGQELWAFVPTETMDGFADMYEPPADTYIGYGLDGSIIAHVEEIGGVERKWIFFGMRRGGRSLYALDVTDRNAPQVLWRIQGGVDSGFDDLAQTWSDPRLARINAGGTPTTVLVFGGGYDAETQDSDDAAAGYLDDTAGNALYIVRAEDGELLWSAGPGGNLQLADMRSSIVAPVDIKDKDEDGLHDLIYAADLGGRIFRFDINNQGASATPSITGGMIASLGANGGTSPGLADNRKFFNEPDVVLVAKDGQAYWAINIGSGERVRPKTNMTTINYLFSIKDRNVFTVPASYSYGITVSDLHDATDNDIQSADSDVADAARADLLQKDGWMVALELAGEKALAHATTFDYRVFFTTFDPTPLDDGDCNSQPGTARLYSMDLLTAGAVTDTNNDNQMTAEDRVSTLPHGTVPPPVTIIFIKDEETGEIEAVGQSGRSDFRPDLHNPSNVRRTFWNVHSEDGKEQ